MSIDLELKLEGAMGESPQFISPEDIVIECIQASIMGAFKVDQVKKSSSLPLFLYICDIVSSFGTVCFAFCGRRPTPART